MIRASNKEKVELEHQCKEAGLAEDVWVGYERDDEELFLGVE